MATDFSYGGKQIVSGGPFKPGGKDMPVDARTRVETYADIASIPNPHVGLKITVKSDETNNNKMTDYIVKSLKANSFGAANSLIDEVVRYVDYLGAGNVSQDDINTAVNKYLTEHPVSGGVTVRDIVDGEIFITAKKNDPDPTPDPTVTYGNIVLSSTNLSVNERGNVTFTVKLDKAPTNNQVVNIAVNNSYCSINPSSLTFTSSNYSATQTVTVTGTHNDTDYANKTSVITLSSTNVSSKTINVTINNIDSQPEGPDPTVSVQSITLNKTESTLNVGDTEQLTVTINPSNATNKNVTWNSNNNEVATVVNGLVTANASGNATISVTSEDGNKTASCSYTVQESSITDPDPDQPTDESVVLFVNNRLSKEATAEDKTNILVDHTNNHVVKTITANTNPTFIPKIISEDGTAIQFVNGVDTGNLKALNAGKLTSLNNTVEIYFESTTAISSDPIYIYDNTGEAGSDNSGGQALRMSNNRIMFVDGGYLYVDITTTIEANTKYHLVAVSDFANKKAYVYLNGVKLYEKDVNSFNTIKEHDVKLGTPQQSAIKYYYFKVYNRALSESEIQTKYGEVN